MKKTLFCASTLLIAASCYAQTDSQFKSLRPAQANNQAFIELQRQVNTMTQQIQELQRENQQLQLKVLQKRQANLSKDFRWVNYEQNTLQKQRVNANLKNSRTPLNVCQAEYLNLGIHPGSLENQACIITYGGVQLTMKHYNALTSKKPVHWVQPEVLTRFTQQQYSHPTVWLRPVHPGNSYQEKNTPRPIIGGYEKGHPVYICRGIFNNELHVGKVVGNACNIAANNKEIILSQYEVMTN